MPVPDITWREMESRFAEQGVEVIATDLGWKYHREIDGEHFYYPALRNLEKKVTLGVLVSICQQLQLDVNLFLK